MSGTLSWPVIVWIIVALGVGVFIYSIVEAEREATQAWKMLEKAFSTENFDKSIFKNSNGVANGLLEIGEAKIGANTRIVPDGVLIWGIKSSMVLIPWSQIRKSSVQPNSKKKIGLRVTLNEKSDLEIHVPWLDRFPSLD